ncbi:lysozyme inhibitor LprI family protein [Phenylobacterium sp.]|uniref:lysozyme inhibitor LprI family protein n=1 Tax=Phenylobacterium sp. TaxID=1871053 RepID=UPI002E3294AF|nr:lysozyme inhibitor LprI family protein [Phenylobacterium sp.]HEX4713068.1 lysozyme inhibitor LprI family protein [Phenylobacterium sp.]
MLDASRRRGDAALSYQVLQEMAARRDTAAKRRPRLKRRAAEQHLVAVDLAEPVETDDLPPMPKWRAPPLEPQQAASPPQREAAPAPAPVPPRRQGRKSPPARTEASAATEPVAAAEVAPPPPAKPSQLRSLHDVEAAATPEPFLLPRPAEPESPRVPRRSHLQVVAVFALGITVGVGLGRWGGGIVRQAASPGAAPMRTAALAPTPLPVPAAPSASEPAPASAPEAPPDAAVEPPSPDPGGGSASPSNAQELARDAASRAEPSPPPPAPRTTDAVATAALAQPAPDRPAPAVANGCASARTPADREICADPSLRRLQRQLQRAYAQALEAHQDRTLLRQRQLAWRDARDTVSDPGRLARLYEQRIHKLNAATAEARRQR